jgi:hypothetical protein
MERHRRNAESPFWRVVLLTLVCAGVVLFLHWLRAAKVVNEDALTLTIVFIVPVAAFVFASDGFRMVGRDLRADGHRSRAHRSALKTSGRSASTFVEPMKQDQILGVKEKPRSMR